MIWKRHWRWWTDSGEYQVMSLTGEIALVTGASRGIGRAIALALGAQGAKVVGTATTEQGAQGVQAVFDDTGIEGLGLTLDVTGPASVDAAMSAIKERFGAPTILVNNAGITRDNLLMRMKEDEWDSVINTNLSSVFRLSKACLRSMMKQRRGRIINIASVVGATGNPGQANYAAAKAGMIGFTKSLAREVGSRGITVNAVAPGFIDTDMTRALPGEQRDQLIGQIPLERLGDVTDVAAAVVFLASAQAGYITGETLHVNGGMHMQ
jgi:3-oxoacyl-[acyl-carrier protein] reductase